MTEVDGAVLGIGATDQNRRELDGAPTIEACPTELLEVADGTTHLGRLPLHLTRELGHVDFDRWASVIEVSQEEQEDCDVKATQFGFQRLKGEQEAAVEVKDGELRTIGKRPAQLLRLLSDANAVQQALIGTGEVVFGAVGKKWRGDRIHEMPVNKAHGSTVEFALPLEIPRK